MKKLIAISILLALLSTAAFAQLKVNLDANFWTDIVIFEQATGQNSDTQNYQGVFNVLSNQIKGGPEVRLKFTYTGPGFEGSLQVRADTFFSRATDQAAANTAIGQFFLDSVFGDWYVKGTAGVINGYVGNGDSRGKMADFRFANAGDYLVNTKVENYGVIAFRAQYSAGGSPADGNLMTSPDPNVGYLNVGAATSATGTFKEVDNLKVGNSRVTLGVDLASLSIPLVIEASSNLAWAGYRLSVADNLDADKNSADSIAAAFRVGGGKFADFISFDVIYRIQGKDPDTVYTANAENIANAFALTTNYWDHDIGAYVGLDIFNGFGVGVGYSAYFRAYENSRLGLFVGNATSGSTFNQSATTWEYVGPVFNGINLHLGFTMIPNLGIYLNNNLSFSWINGENDGNARQIVAFDGTPQLMKTTDEKETWFALWNTLAVKYQITPKVGATLAISNNLGVFEHYLSIDNGDVSKWTTNNFSIGANAAYAFNSNISFQGGLTFGFWEQTAEVNQGSTLVSGRQGAVTFAVPIQFKVAW